LIKLCDMLLCFCTTFLLGFATIIEGPGKRKRFFAERKATSIEDIIQRKLREAELLEKEHSDVAKSDVRRRLSFASTSGTLRMSQSLRRRNGSPAVIADIKRRGTNGIELAKFEDASLVSAALSAFPIDALCLGIDYEIYGGYPEEISKTKRRLQEENLTIPIIAKDFIVAPIHIAMLAEIGADAVILITTILGSTLEDLLNTCTLVGIEALVEVYTPNELRFALNAGASAILVNNFDRINNEFTPNQALGLRDLIPPNIITAVTGGITDFSSAARYAAAGYDALFLDSALVGSPPESSRPLVQRIRTLSRSPLQGMTPASIAADLSFASSSYYDNDVPS